MLNKDQYNQEEYNNYYRQEIEGSELGGSTEEKGLISKLIIVLIILALTIAGYFGYKAMSNPSTDDIDTSLKVSAESSLPQSIQNEPETKSKEEKEPNSSENKAEVEVVKKETTPSTTPKKQIEESKVAKIETVETIKTIDKKQPQNTEPTATSKVQDLVKKQIGDKMSPEEIATIIAAVMKQIKQEKATNSSTTSPSITKQDVDLMKELSSSEVDSVSANLIKELEEVDISEKTKIDNSKKQIDVYNKVTVQNAQGEDHLSKLSSEINSVIEEGIEKNKASNYTKSLKSEVSVRKNEMRIIIVKKGDTLGKIAQRAYGNVMDYKKIYRANPEITRPDRIYIGQKLRIPN